MEVTVYQVSYGI